MNSNVGPLTGYKVLDFTGFESGTVCTETLAWMGAEVWKVERPGLGDLARFSVEDREKDSVGFIILNMNKKSITCDMKTEEGKQIIRELLTKADVFVENMGPGSIDRLGFGYDVVKEIAPQIVYAQLKGFGQDGPYRDYPAFNPIAAATGGLPAMNGEAGGPPMQCGINVADSGAGYILAMGIIAALLQRERQGIGQKVEVAMQDVVVTFGRSNWEPYYRNGQSPKRKGSGMNLDDVAPCDMYPCKPGGENDYVHIYCSRHPGSKQFDNLCKVMGREDLLEDERFSTPRLRYKHRDVLDPIIINWTMQHTKQEAMDILCKADIPAGAVLDTDDITKDEYLLKRGVMMEIEHKDRGKLRLPGLAPRLSENHVEYKVSPSLGEHNTEIYQGVLGMSEEKLKELYEKKVI